MAEERLQKILAKAGVASRRHAETLITEGRVRVNGRVVRELGVKADFSKDRVEVDGERLVRKERVYVLFHKPRGVVSTMHDPEGRPTVKDALATAGTRAYPVGRLDFATSGALLATNDGDFAAGLLHPKKAVPKEYIVKVHGEMQQRDLDRWREGLELDDGHRTSAADVSFDRHEAGKTWFSLVLREGHNQQIRRMGKATGFEVMRLARISFAGISTEGLRPGAWRYLTREELVALKKTYGVPRAIPSGAPAVEAKGRGARGEGPRGERARGEGARGGRARGERARGEGAKGEGRGTRSAGARGEGREGAGRYGGGAAGRSDVGRDWGGGAGRGRTGAGRAAEGGDVAGGRMGRTRTTGTAGGVGAREDAPRVKGRRG